MQNISSGAPILERMKLAVNMYYQSLNLHSPYKMFYEETNNLPACVWLNIAEEELVKYRQGVLYICDLEGSRQLETALSKVNLLGKGITWPLVAFESAATSMLWIMIPEITDESNTLQALDAKFWFMIPLELQSLFEFTISLLNLLPTKSKLRCTCVQRLHGKCQNINDWDMPLFMVIDCPGDFVASVSNSFFDNHDRIDKSHSKKDITTIMCVIDKKYRTDFRPHSDKTHQFHQDMLEHHFLTKRVPAVIYSRVNEVLTGLRYWLETWRQNEVTIKEEPLSFKKVKREEFIGVSDTSEQAATFTPTAHLIKSERMANAALLIECPVCPSAFQYGLCCEGIDLLIDHVHNFHKRLISHCNSLIRNKYSEVLEDREVHRSYCTNCDSQ